MVTISIGRNNPRKGFEYGNKTPALLKKACINIAYVLVGRSMKSIMELARQLRVSNCLIAPGQVEAASVAQLLQTSDIYLSTSIVESFGYTTLEAMSAWPPGSHQGCGPDHRGHKVADRESRRTAGDGRTSRHGSRPI